MKAALIRRFEDEIIELERELRTKLPEEIRRAREFGDLRENAEYKAAKERQSFLQSRIAMLKKRVGEISMMNLDNLPRGRAAFGSSVHVKEQNKDDIVVYQLVMAEDADASRGLVSTSSPIGRSLMGKEVGDEVNVPTPGGVRSFEVVKLITVHDQEP